MDDAQIKALEEICLIAAERHLKAAVRLEEHCFEREIAAQSDPEELKRLDSLTHEIYAAWRAASVASAKVLESLQNARGG